MADMGEEMQGKFNSLTSAQQAAMYQEAVNTIDSNKQASKVTPVTPDKVAEYAQLGAAIGSALASTAKELGIVANDFLKTPVGAIAATLIVWKVAGEAVVHVVGGGLLFTVFLPVWWISFRRTCFAYTAVVHSWPREDGKMESRTTKTPIKNEGGVFLYWITFAAAVVICSWIAFSGF